MGKIALILFGGCCCYYYKPTFLTIMVANCRKKKKPKTNAKQIPKLVQLKYTAVILKIIKPKFKIVSSVSPSFCFILLIIGVPS